MLAYEWSTGSAVSRATNAPLGGSWPQKHDCPAAGAMGLLRLNPSTGMSLRRRDDVCPGSSVLISSDGL